MTHKYFVSIKFGGESATFSMLENSETWGDLYNKIHAHFQDFFSVPRLGELTYSCGCSVCPWELQVGEKMLEDDFLEDIERLALVFEKSPFPITGETTADKAATFMATDVVGGVSQFLDRMARPAISLIVMQIQGSVATDIISALMGLSEDDAIAREFPEDFDSEEFMAKFAEETEEPAGVPWEEEENQN